MFWDRKNIDILFKISDKFNQNMRIVQVFYSVIIVEFRGKNKLKTVEVVAQYCVFWFGSWHLFGICILAFGFVSMTSFCD